MSIERIMTIFNSSYFYCLTAFDLAYICGIELLHKDRKMMNIRFGPVSVWFGILYHGTDHVRYTGSQY